MRYPTPQPEMATSLPLVFSPRALAFVVAALRTYEDACREPSPARPGEERWPDGAESALQLADGLDRLLWDYTHPEAK